MIKVVRLEDSIVLEITGEDDNIHPLFTDRTVVLSPVEAVDLAQEILHLATGLLPPIEQIAYSLLPS